MSPFDDLTILGRVLKALVEAHREVAGCIDAGRPDAVQYVQDRWSVSRERAQAALTSLRGCFVARLESADFRTVIGNSARVLGLSPMPGETLLAGVGSR